ncbi:MAG: histidyl-tRNA synthetase [Candidatus Poriferisodalaceae bacterium]|jgi:histidyl-tRNA synthetase|tara:strand:+ start:2017 stop:3294 length:1278 start_codon:yes stop_codon:yes gene_type:complete
MSTKPNSFQTPIGTSDLLPLGSARWQATLQLFDEVSTRSGFGYLSTPIFEDIGVFSRVGEGTDVVRKEMYEFLDKSDRRLALRPEGTAAVCRAFVQHHPVTPWKVYYHGPFFRYEAPQAGRYRQFHQLGIETLGSDDPDADVEVMALAWEMFQKMGLKQVELSLNSMGDGDTRLQYAEALTEYLNQHRDAIDEEDREKISDHPMRVLDSKRRATRKVTDEAPKISDFLSASAIAHFDRVQDGLTALDIPYKVEPRLVRGLDYYTHTTFEFQSKALSAAQNTICGGGRYNGLVEELGGPVTPGIGFGMGIERLLLACDAEEVFPAPKSSLDVWVIDVAGGSHARDITYELRSHGINADRSFDSRSMRSQMRSANRSGAPIALIIGEDEVAAGNVALRSMLDNGVEQILIPRDQIAVEVLRSLGSRS